MFIDDSVNRIRSFISQEPVEGKRRKPWSKFKLAREAKLSPNSLRDIHLDSFNATVDTLRKLEGVIDAEERRAREEAPAQPEPVPSEYRE